VERFACIGYFPPVFELPPSCILEGVEGGRTERGFTTKTTTDARPQQIYSFITLRSRQYCFKISVDIIFHNILARSNLLSSVIISNTSDSSYVNFTNQNFDYTMNKTSTSLFKIRADTIFHAYILARNN